MLRLPRLCPSKYEEKPSGLSPLARPISPPGGSTLITSAPMSASSNVANGPCWARVKSSTRTPVSADAGAPAGGGMIVSGCVSSVVMAALRPGRVPIDPPVIPARSPPG